MPQVQTDRPPYVQFERREIEDRNATEAAGAYRGKDIAFAIITPMGSKDRYEQIAEEWFVKLEQQVREGRFPPEWLGAYKTAYAAWKEGLELPVDGTPIRNWPLLSPAQVRLLTDLRVRAVEDLAAANEELMMRLGMGGRALKAKAVEFLAAQAPGQSVERITRLERDNTAKDLEIASLRETVTSLESQVQQLLRAAPLAAPAGRALGTPAEDEDTIDRIASSMATEVDNGLAAGARRL